MALTDHLTPTRHGDGWEYLGMTISLANHGTPDLRADDIQKRTLLVSSFPHKRWQSGGDTYTLYKQNRKGRWYGSHFWAYPAFCVPAYIFLKLLRANPLKVFQLTNTLLLLFAIGWLLFRSALTWPRKYWLLLLTIFSPVWFYIPWSHPEIFSFTFAFVGLLEHQENHKLSACLFFALASWQNPALVLLIALPYARQVTQGKWNSRTILRTSPALGLAALPYLFFWYHFGKFSLVADAHTFLKKFTLAKVGGLFLDPNYGMLAYVPVAFALLLYLILKRDGVASGSFSLMLLMAAVCATHGNWNCGMQYIHRYAFWMLPLLFFSTLSILDRWKKGRLIAMALVHLLISGSITAWYIVRYDLESHLKFNTLARTILAVAPGFYNPPAEVFAERCLGMEINEDRLPNYLTLANAGGLRKTLFFDRQGAEHYRNAHIALGTDLEMVSLHQLSLPGDILISSFPAGLSLAWSPLRMRRGMIARDVSQRAFVGFWTARARKIYLRFVLAKAGAFKSLRIDLNGRAIYQEELEPSPQEISITEVSKAGINLVRLVAIDDNAQEMRTPRSFFQPRACCFQVYRIEIFSGMRASK